MPVLFIAVMNSSVAQLANYQTLYENINLQHLAECYLA